MSTSTQMLAEIRRETRLTALYTGIETLSPAVLEAFARVDRAAFVPEAQRPHAYANHPLPIGRGQTISQPFIVALMTELAAPHPEARVLDVGTGCGYQAAILAELVAEVYSLEILPELSAQAEEHLRRLGYERIQLRSGDGYEGWPEAAPFDAIVVSSAAPVIPEPLCQQLKPGGRLVVPVGPAFGPQRLYWVEKQAEGQLTRHGVLDVAFVPMTGRLGMPSLGGGG